MSATKNECDEGRGRPSRPAECPAEKTGAQAGSGGWAAGQFEPFITKLTVAERLGVQVRTVTRLMSRGVLRHYKVGPMVRFKWSEVDSDMREHLGVGFGERGNHGGLNSQSQIANSQ